jgi:hypothetical protein
LVESVTKVRLTGAEVKQEESEIKNERNACAENLVANLKCTWHSALE